MPATTNLFMARLRNITISTVSMASDFNSTSETTGEPYFKGRWEDVQKYTSIITTVLSPDNVTINIDWTNTKDDRVPDDAATEWLATDSFKPLADTVVTKQFDTRARWVRVRVEGGDVTYIATTYKNAPTEIKITDDTTNIVNVNLGDTKNSLYTVLSDVSGIALRTTDRPGPGQALYTHLADISGASLRTTDTYRDITRNADLMELVPDARYELYFSRAEDASCSFVMSENSFRVSKDYVGVRPDDIVQFVMLRDGESLMNLPGSFAGTTDVSGHIKVTGRIKYVAEEPNHVRYQILTGPNTSNWFSQSSGFPFSSVSLNAMNTGQRQWTNSGASVFSFRDLSAGTPPSAGKFVTVDNLYDIIADPSGFDLAAAGINVSGDPMINPLDLRIYRGSLETTGSRNHLALMHILRGSKTYESLGVALRDSSNQNIGSTGVNSTGYLVDAFSGLQRHNVLLLLDATNNYGNYTSMVQQKTYADIVFTSLAGEVQTALVDSHDDVSSCRVIRYGATDTIATYQALVGAGSNYLGLPDSLNAPGSPMPINYWGAAAKYANNGFAPNQPADPDVTATILFVSSTDSLRVANDDASRNSFEATGYYNGRQCFAIAPAVTSDLLSFATSPDHIYTYKYPSDPDTAESRAQFAMDISAIADNIAYRLSRTAHVGHNALKVHTADVCGHSQAGTKSITGSRFGDVALFYALADNCGAIIDTTRTSNGRDLSNNALYVHLADDKGRSISENNGLFVKLDADIHDSYLFDLTVCGTLVTTADISSVRLSDASAFNINSISITNETPGPVWIKVFDMSTGFVSSDPTLDTSARGVMPHLIYNFAVPGLNYRDLQFSKPVLFRNGLYFVASTNFRYDDWQYGPGNQGIYVQGSYSKASRLPL